MNELVETATNYARRGLYVFPCGHDKRPLKKWTQDERPSPEAVRFDFLRYPSALIGCAMGPSGLVAIDIDSKNGIDGWAALELRCHEWGPLPSTRQRRTRCGGAHLIFRAPAGFEFGP
jgi:hypothetical protein